VIVSVDFLLAIKLYISLSKFNKSDMFLEEIKLIYLLSIKFIE
jgi:hypothetical protein